MKKDDMVAKHFAQSKVSGDSFNEMARCCNGLVNTISDKSDWRNIERMTTSLDKKLMTIINSNQAIEFANLPTAGNYRNNSQTELLNKVLKKVESIETSYNSILDKIDSFSSPADNAISNPLTTVPVLDIFPNTSNKNAVTVTSVAHPSKPASSTSKASFVAQPRSLSPKQQMLRFGTYWSREE
ncbi:unnamed protein product [Hermetia illucens]|uniref:Uncharacterized protein n=1 Tax=Hermetia illucens TaxID=343691 RepID=A0A7R8Z223_HERIL|nr:unnamed protein product [Hermetia illucens]